MQIRKLIERTIRRSAGGVELDSDVNAVVAANVGERGAVTQASSEERASVLAQPPKAERRDTA